MRRKTPFLMATMPLFAIATLGGCNTTPRNSTPKSVEPEESKPLEVGDTVRMWTSPDDYEKAPLGLAEGSGTLTISTMTITLFPAPSRKKAISEVTSSRNHTSKMKTPRTATSSPFTITFLRIATSRPSSWRPSHGTAVPQAS